MKRIVIIAILVVVALGALAAVSIKRVPEGHEAIRVDRNGDVALLTSGLRFVTPGYADFIVYPVGEQTYRCPEEGTFEVLSQEGDAVPVAFEVTVSLPAGAAVALYGHFTRDFDSAIQRVVEAAAEIEAAMTSSSGDAESYRARVQDAVDKQLVGVDVDLLRLTLEQWGGAEPVAGLPADVSVAPEPPCRVVVIGMDGADWLNLRPLVNEGRLPNFKRLLDEGATGPLRTIEPMLSPLLWTTMATGKYPEEHGILNFTVADPETGEKLPITRYYRKVDAFWNMLGDYGRTVCVAGWLATDPAESINGVMVTDKVGYLAFAPAGDAGAPEAGTISPGARASEIAGLVTRSGEVTYDECKRFLDVGRDEFVEHRDAEQDPRDSINNFISLYASTRTYADIALHLLETDQPDALAVYFEWIDAVSHLFMLQAAPRMPSVPVEEYRRFGRAVEESYVYQDEILGRIMDAIDDNTVIMVVSDHGFKSGASRLQNRPEIWAGNAAKWHRLDGVVAFWGAGVDRGAQLHGATILDVAPTILALQGLPRPADMPGRILEQAFDTGLRARFNPNTVATLERAREDEVAEPGKRGAASEQTLKKLEALGYLTPDNADAHNNLGQRYQQRGEYMKAIEEYEKAIALRPNFYSAYNNIAICYGKLGRTDEAELALQTALDINPNNFYAMNNLAVLYIEKGNLDRARPLAEKCVETEPGYVNGRITLGSVYAISAEFDRAERQFREALRLEPDNERAVENLRRLDQARAQHGSQ